ncbi:MAG: SDR family NAD(P)-dependent oxidoreductase [Verrucomicrobia bacterium]|nr:SDR family NAD(P)-dependent oxidoreductase [Verrucomicrobiota bacterium]
MTSSGRIVLVTGAGQGIGSAIAHALASAGGGIAVNDVRPEAAERTCRELRDKGFAAMAVPADVSDEKAVAAMVQTVTKHLGPIDVLVNNAAAPAPYRLFAESAPEEQANELMTLMGALHCTRHVCPEMIRRRSDFVGSSPATG